MARLKTLFFTLSLVLLLAGPATTARAQLVFGPGPESPANNLDAIVAVVNDDVITRRELNAAMATVERQLRQKKVALPPQSVLERQVLERLILGKLQVRVAERNGITVDDTTLNAAIDNLARRNNMSLSQLQQSVEKDGVSFSQFRDDVRREILIARLRQRMVETQIQISEQDVESLRAQLAGSPEMRAGGAPGGEGPRPTGGEGGGTNRQYHIAQILIAVPESASPEQIATAKRQAEDVLARLRQGSDFQALAVSVSADQQALQGGDLGWRSADQLPTLFAEVVPKLQPGQSSGLIRSPSGFHIVKLLEVRGGGSAARPAAAPGTPPASTTPTTAAMVTQTHARHILLTTSGQRSDAEARQQLEQLRQRIKAGADFAALARADSDDKASGARGGDLGWVMPGMLVPQFEQEMDRLQPGEISPPFQTQFGWHIVQVLERRQVQGSADSERARIREALFRRRADEEWDLQLRRLRDEAYVEIRLPPATAAP